MPAIGPKDKYCFVDSSRGFQYTDYEFEVVQYGPEETQIKDPHTNERLSFYNAHLYVTREQQQRSVQKKIQDAQTIGRNVRNPRKRR